MGCCKGAGIGPLDLSGDLHPCHQREEPPLGARIRSRRLVLGVKRCEVCSAAGSSGYETRVVSVLVGIASKLFFSLISPSSPLLGGSSPGRRG